METASNLAKSGADLAKAVPVYDDLLQPAVKQLGTGLETITKAVNVALAPLSALVWGYDQICVWLEAEVSKRLHDVSPQQVTVPDPHVVGPAVEALRYAAGSESLRDMFAQLIATSMNAEVAGGAHPTFVEILKQLSPDEAKLVPYFQSNTYYPILSLHVDNPDFGQRTVMKHWSTLCIEAECEFPGYAAAYYGNLERLGLVEFDYRGEVEDEHYREMQKHPAFARLLNELQDEEPQATPVIERGIMMRTMLGQMFINACVGETTGSQVRVTHRAPSSDAFKP